MLKELTEEVPCLHCGSNKWGIILEDPLEENSKGFISLLGECDDCGKMFNVELNEEEHRVSLRKIKVKKLGKEILIQKELFKWVRS